MIDYVKIASENRKKLDNINVKVRVYNNLIIDFYYKNKLIITVMTKKINEKFICKYMIESYNIYMKYKKFGKRNLIEMRDNL